MAYNDNVVFKTSTTATIDDLFSWDKSTGQITAKTDSIPIVPGTVYFTADGHIVHDLAQNNRVWMGKNAYSAIYAEDISETHTDIANTYLKRTGGLLEGSGTVATSASEQRSGDTSAATYYYPAVWRFNIAETPKNGDIIVIKTPVAGHDNGIFISIDYDSSHPEQAHYQPVLANGTSRLANQYGAGTSLILIYEANTTVSQVYNVGGSKARVNITGAWRVLNYYDSTNIYQLRTGYARVLGPSTGDSTATKSLYKFEFLIEDKNGLLIPFGFQNDKTTTYNKALTTASFNPFSPIFYYSSTTTVNVGSNIAAHSLYGQTIADCRYSFNINSNGTAGTTAFTANLPVYIKALYNYSTGTATFVQNISSSNYLERSSLTQNLPTTNPNINLSPGQEYIYIQLGNAYNKYQVDLNAFNKVVYHWDSINNTCKLFTPVAVTNNTINLTRNTETTIATINNTPIKIKLPVSDNTDYKVRQTPINSNDNNNYRILLSNSANDTSEDSISKKNANLIYNPTENKLSTGNLDLTGNINVVGDATFNNTTTIDNAILNSLLVSGNSSFVNNVNFTQIPTAPTATAGTSTTQIATTEFVTNAVAQGFVANDAMVFKGLIGSNQPITQLPTSGYNAGWTYRVANAGIFAGEYCEVGDLLIAINDGPASGSSVINTDWGKVEHNIDGAVFRGSGASNSSVGSSTQPVYVNGSGIVTAITGAIANDITGNAATATVLSSSGTTNQFWRGDNSWSNTLGFIKINSEIKIKGYGDNNNYWHSIKDLSTVPLTNDCWHYLPNSTGWIVSSSTNGTGNSTTPIYIDEGGVTRAITGTISNNTTGNAATATTATNATQLISNNRMDYGWNGINYFNILTSNQSAAKVNDTPFSSNVWTHILRFNRNDPNGYYTDLAIPFGQNSIYYKRIAAGSLQNSTTNGGWIKVLDQLNYTSYTVTKTGSGASGTWNINISGNAATATTAGGITSAGTTAQFWRGDNTWSNMLEQTTATTLGINTSDLRIGKAIRTLHIATSDNGTGAGVADGQAAGITFGVSNAAYAGIYYQSSNGYGSRLCFATTRSFGNGAYARMVITRDGNVGIGTLSPSTLLHVAGDVTVTGLNASQAVATDANKKLVSADLYWANIKATLAASYNKTPEVANIKLNGNISATAASTKNVQLVYDTSLETLNFVFS